MRSGQAYTPLDPRVSVTAVVEPGCFFRTLGGGHVLITEEKVLWVLSWVPKRYCGLIVESGGIMGYWQADGRFDEELSPFMGYPRLNLIRPLYRSDRILDLAVRQSQTYFIASHYYQSNMATVVEHYERLVDRAPPGAAESQAAP